MAVRQRLYAREQAPAFDAAGVLRSSLGVIWQLGNAVLVVLLLALLAIIALAGGLLAFARWIECQTVYGGDTSAQAKDKWRGL